MSKKLAAHGDVARWHPRPRRDRAAQSVSKAPMSCLGPGGDVAAKDDPASGSSPPHRRRWGAWQGPMLSLTSKIKPDQVVERKDK